MRGRSGLRTKPTPPLRTQLPVRTGALLPRGASAGVLALSHTLSLREARVSGVWAHLLPVEGEWGLRRAPGSCPLDPGGGSSLDTTVPACRLSPEPVTQWS